MNGIKSLLESKKAIVYIVTVIIMAAVLFTGVDAALADDFTDKLYKLAMAYLGGQGLADLGRYAGEAYKSGKRVVSSAGGPVELTAEIGEVATDVQSRVSDVADAVEDRP